MIRLLCSLLVCAAAFGQEVPLLGLAHAGIRVSDLDKAHSFYNGVLGYEDAFDAKKPDGNLFLQYYKVNETQYLEIYPGLTTGMPLRLTHIAIYTDDIDKLHGFLIEQGLLVTDVKVSIDSTRFCNIRRPPGQDLGAVEFVQYMPDSLHVKAKGKATTQRRLSRHMRSASVPVTDLPTAVGFYRRLDFHEVWRGGPESNDRIRRVHMQLPGTSGDYIELVDRLLPVAGDEAGLGPRFSLDVSDIQLARRLAMERGAVDVAQPRVRSDNRLWSSLMDPDGTSVVLEQDEKQELPAYYRHVERFMWVVDDIDRCLAGWQKLNIANAVSPRDVTMDVQFLGAVRPSHVRWAEARFADITVDFIQPLEGVDAFSAFSQQHGAGVLSLVHRVPTVAALDAEADRMQKLGVRVLQTGSIPSAQDSRYILFDTAPEGKYALGLVYLKDDSGVSPSAAQRSATTRKLTQYAFAVGDTDAVSRYWAQLGLPPLSFTHPYLWDVRYQNRPVDVDAQVGWQRHGDVVYEWIQPLKGPTCYLDHVAKHGEGLHHIAFEVDDIERESSEWTRIGFRVEQEGAFGVRNQAGYGRFAYQDTHTIGGIDVELLWHFKASADGNVKKGQ